MRNLTPERRRIVLLAVLAGLFASLPVLLFSQLSGPLHHVLFGLSLAVSLVLLTTTIRLFPRLPERH